MPKNLSYAKTPKGIEEMTSRRHGLGQRVRRLLILVDGKRTLQEFAANFPSENVAAIVESLLAEGFISVLAQPASGAESPQAAETIQPPGDDAERFTMARNFMMNTVAHFLGVTGSSLFEKIDNSSDLEQLRGHYMQWRDAIQLSSEGRSQIGELESRLAALLS